MTNVIYANMKHRHSFSHIVCKQNIKMLNVVMYFPKNFYLLEAINGKLNGLISSGILSHIIEKYVDMRYWNYKKQATKQQALNFEHLRGSFQIWVHLVFLAVVVFVCELLRKKFLRYLVWLKHFFN